MPEWWEQDDKEKEWGKEDSLAEIETTTAVLEDPNEAYKRGVETQDLSVDLEIPLEISEQIADVLDGEKPDRPGFLKRGFKEFVNKAFVQPFKNIIKGGAVGQLDTELDALGEIRRIKEETGREVSADEFAEIMAKSRAKVSERVQAAAPSLQIPPPEGKVEKGLGIATGLAAFLTKLAIARRFVGGSGAASEIAAFEVVNQVDDGTPGMGVLLASSLGLVGKVPAATIAGKGFKLAGQGGVLAGITAAEGGSPEDIAVSFFLPSILRAFNQFPNLVRGKAFDIKTAKDVHRKLPFMRDVPLKNVRQWSAAMRDAIKVKAGSMTPKRWGKKHGKNLQDFSNKTKQAYEAVNNRVAGKIPGEVKPTAKKLPAKAVVKPPTKPTEAITPKKPTVIAKPTKIEPAPLKKPVTVSGKEYHPQTIPVESIGVDPQRFQFKLGAKLAGGVTEALKAVEKYDPVKAGEVLVWQDKEGKYWVIDGHHRVALARKTGQDTMDAWVVREEDGWKEADARATGALRNLADGKGTAVDAAKLFRDSNITLEQLRKEGVPTNNSIVQQGMEMKDLSDEVFRLVIDERLPANMAAAIGREVKGPTQQKQVADLILEGEIETVRQAEFLAMTIDTAPVLTKQEQTLFGVETTEKSLYAERAKILANVEKKLKTNKTVFGTLAKQSGLIESKGNILDKVRNMETKELAEEVLYMLDKFANAKGEVAEALNEATKEYAKYPTRDNLTKITNDLVQKWTEATTGLTVQNIKGLFGPPTKRAEPEIEAKQVAKAEPAVEKQPWEMTEAEFQVNQIAVSFNKPLPSGMTKKEWESKVGIFGNHEDTIKEALKEGKPVPREVLQEYKSEPWAQKALKEAPAEKVVAPKAEKKVVEEKDNQFSVGGIVYTTKGIRKDYIETLAKGVRDKVYEYRVNKRPIMKGKKEVGIKLEYIVETDKGFTKITKNEYGYLQKILTEKVVAPKAEPTKVERNVWLTRIPAIQYIKEELPKATIGTLKEDLEFYKKQEAKYKHPKKGLSPEAQQLELREARKAISAIEEALKQPPAQAKGIIEEIYSDRVPPTDVPHKMSLQRAVIKTLNEDAQKVIDSKRKYKGLKNHKELYDKFFKDKPDLFIHPENPMPELQSAWTVAVKGKSLFGRAGKLDVTPLQDAFDMFMNIIEPSKAVEIKLGKEVYATVIKGVHKADVARIMFNEQEIETMDRNLREFGEALAKYPKKVLQNLMMARGKPYSPGAIEIRDQALKDLAKEAPELVGLRKTITKIADFNYKYLQDVVGDDIHYVEDYFYGIYKDPGKVERFIQYWKTTKRFTKEKKLPTVADAVDYGLELRDYNPVNNLMSEYMAIARLEGMIEMRDALMKTGEDKYISKDPEKLADPDKIPEPVFRGLWVDADLARMIKKLISANKIQRYPILNGLRKLNNVLRSIKFTFSMFHHLAEAKQSVADSGYFGFLHKKTALSGVTFGFKKGDPIFLTEEYKDYIAHGGGHRYSIDSEAQRAFTRAIEKLTKSSQLIVRGATAPLRIPEGYIRWLFGSYIPRVKYAKYLDTINEKQQKLGRKLTSPEKIDIIKEQQNFYGMMNERLFGRSGTVTTLMRFKFMAPGFAEGNFRTILKAILQWGQEGSFVAGRSRANIINSFLLTGIAATIGTLILTGKLPEKPKEAGDIRDMFKIDTGKNDIKGRRIMIDLMSYDKDYWTIFGKPLVGQAGEVPRDVFRRIGGMTATTWEVMSDLNKLSMGEAIYDWKGDRVTEVTDPFARRVLDLIIHETRKAEPISTNIFRQSRNRGFDRLTAAITTLLGARPTTSEKDKRELKIINRIFSLRDRQERLYYFLGTIKKPREHIDRYNKIAQSILDNPVTTKEMREKWGENLIIDTERLVSNKVHAYELARVTDKPKPDELEKLKKWLTNFGITKDQYRKQLIVYEMKHRKLILEMKASDADELLKNEIAKFYADKGILERKVKDGTATDAEKRESRKYSKISSNISEIGTLIHKTLDITKRKRYYERVRSLIERSE